MAEINLASHQYANQVISQTSEETLISGVLIPKGYVNATEMCKASGKRWAKYLEYSKTQEYLVKLSESFSGTDLIIQILHGDINLRGTWIHHLIALDLAAWSSVDFKFWANKTLWHVINGNFQALTNEAEEAQKQLLLIWDKVRRSGIDNGRLPLTDAIRDWYQRNPGATSRPIHAMYAVTTNAIYQALWNVDAKNLEQFLGCSRNESRDHIDANSLRTLERAEARVAEFIDEDNIKPIEAVTAANIKKAKQQVNKK
ncbi:KilA domain-containing protein [Calothrix sp. NIES-2100]|uniref:KilA-N domain-containing protein n=1 Tax=Calothrix sp. NIES-2100 TaxID=1954172 RepID=UPI000B5E1886|nr:KilA domain-containing protein [Calothrix sp. NIES-2100]